MSRRAVTWLRVLIVALYAAVGGAMALGGVNAGELVLMVMFGAIAFIAIVTVDWINNAVRRDFDEKMDDYGDNPR